MIVKTPGSQMGSVGQCSWEGFESSQRRCGGAMHRQPSAALPVCTRAVAASEPDVLVSHLAIERADDYDLITAMLSVHPALSCTVLGLSARQLVSQGWDPKAYSCISTLR